jgi:predicted GNAT superfamily acetyltransferase
MPDTTPLPTPPAQAGQAGQPRLDIRRIASWPEYRACVELQHVVWGGEFSDQVPASLLSVAQRIGGVTAGAFEPDGKLLGFVFGMSGVLGGRLVHWSDLLAVRPDARDRGIGRQLKMFQRDLVRSMGATVMYWTYDALVARNAYLNLMLLGAEPVEYVEDMYGSNTLSILHQGIGTDRLIMGWSLEDSASAGRPAVQPPPAEQIPLLNATLNVPTDTPWVGISVPLRIDQLQRTSLPEAQRWRSETRAAFQWAFAYGYRVVHFRRIEATDTGLYSLARGNLITTPRPPRPGSPGST